MKTPILWLSVVAALAPFTPALAQSVMTNDEQMTLYTFDKDADGKSACNDDCAKNWPPNLGKAGEAKDSDWTLIERTDGTMQWAYKGKPTYLYHEDMQAGDMKGDGKGGVWHVIAQ